MPTLDEQALVEMARAWVSADPESATAAQLAAWIDSRDINALRECFEAPMQFGTAGLRGTVGPGPAHMNLAMIRRATRGLAEYLARKVGGVRTVIIGHDARIDSPRFAREAIATASAAGCEVIEFEGNAPTPLVAFNALRHGAAAGVVVTASHNPPEYNGYKVYSDLGIQIVSPADTLIAEQMHRLTAASEIPVDFKASTRVLSQDAFEQYAQAVLNERPAHDNAAVRVAYTPLHGVGWQAFELVMRLAGHADLHAVPSQVRPDGHFPTVRFPNPEEPGTLDLGMQYASSIGAHLLIANDPDADRLALSLPDEHGQWHALSGNQIGIILMDYLLGKASGTGHAHSAQQPFAVTTVVSTPMADAIAASYRAHLERTLTGFKWLWTASLELSQNPGRRFAIAWEEAMGYSTHSSVRDKDGIAAGLIAADWVAECRASAILPYRRLGELYRRHGAWGGRQLNVHCHGADGAAVMHQSLCRLAEDGPKHLDGIDVASIEDFREGAAGRSKWQGANELFAVRMKDGARIMVRPSGTEPKLKLYVDVPDEVLPHHDPFVRVDLASARAERLGRALIEVMGLQSARD